MRPRLVVAILVAATTACGARTGLMIDDGSIGACCPDGQLLLFDPAAGCDAAPRCVPVHVCTPLPPIFDCSCKTRQETQRSCDGALTPVSTDHSCLTEPGIAACDSVRGPVRVRDNPPRQCKDDEICGHLDGAATFTCCNPSIECGRCAD